MGGWGAELPRKSLWPHFDRVSSWPLTHFWLEVDILSMNTPVSIILLPYNNAHSRETNIWNVTWNSCKKDNSRFFLPRKCHTTLGIHWYLCHTHFCQTGNTKAPNRHLISVTDALLFYSYVMHLGESTCCGGTWSNQVTCPIRQVRQTGPSS